MVPAVILSVVALVAGHSTQVVCDATLNGHATAQGGELGWTAYGGSTVYVVPELCADASAKVGTVAFAQAIGTFIHEAAHARGIRSESCAEMIADIGVYDVLQRFYGVPFFSATSLQVGRQVLAATQARPAAYQPASCWLSGAVG